MRARWSEPFAGAVRASACGRVTRSLVERFSRVRKRHVGTVDTLPRCHVFSIGTVFSRPHYIVALQYASF